MTNQQTGITLVNGVFLLIILSLKKLSIVKIFLPQVNENIALC